MRVTEKIKERFGKIANTIKEKNNSREGCIDCGAKFNLIRWRKKCTKCRLNFCNKCITDKFTYDLCLECAKETALVKEQWVTGTAEDTLTGYEIVREIGLKEVNGKCSSTAEVIRCLENLCAIDEANSYVKFHTDKHTDSRSVRYQSGTNSDGKANYSYKTETEEFFTGHAFAVIVKKLG